jgi:hypothetical protein
VDDPGADGATDYRGPLQDDLDLEAFSVGTLRAVAEEVALQGHLLVLSFWMAVADRDGPEAADALVRRQLMGVGAIASERIRVAFDLSADLAGVASVLELHPLFRPRAYVDATVELDQAADRVVVRLADCPALAETEARSWPALLAGNAEGLAAVVWGADRRAVVTELDGANGPAWAITLGDEARPEPVEATLTRFSTGAAFEFEDR